MIGSFSSMIGNVVRDEYNKIVDNRGDLTYCRCTTCNKWVAEVNLYPFHTCKTCYESSEPKIQDLDNKF